MNAELYFQQQVRQAFGEQQIFASGYFRSIVDPAASSSSLLGDAGGVLELGKLLAAGAKARGFYLALTDEHLWVVVTRASATKAPIRENLGVLPVPRSLLAVRADGSKLVLVIGELELALELWLDNQAFPAQAQLIEMLCQSCGSGVSVNELRRQQRSARVRRIGTVVGLAAAGVGVAFLVNALKG